MSSIGTQIPESAGRKQVRRCRAFGCLGAAAILAAVCCWATQRLTDEPWRRETHREAGGRATRLTYRFEAAHPSWSPDGTKIAYSASSVSALSVLGLAWLAPSGQGKPTNAVGQPASSGVGELWFMDSDGRNHRRAEGEAPPSLVDSPHWDPQGMKLLFDGLRPTAKGEVRWSAWVYDLSAKKYEGLTKDEEVTFPNWSPDGKSVLFLKARRKHLYGLWVADADGQNARLVSSLPVAFLSSGQAWSPDSQEVAFVCHELRYLHSVRFQRKTTIWVVRRDGSRPRKLSDHDAEWIGWDRRGASVLVVSSVRPSRQEGLQTIVSALTASRRGEEVRLAQLPGLVGSVTLSPTRERLYLLLGNADHGFDVWRVDLASGATKALTTAGNAVGLSEIAVSPDGRSLLFVRETKPEGRRYLWRLDVND